MRAILWMEWLSGGFVSAARALLLAVVTPLLEKSAVKTMTARSRRR